MGTGNFEISKKLANFLGIKSLRLELERAKERSEELHVVWDRV